MNNIKEKVVQKLIGKPICPKCKDEIEYLRFYTEHKYFVEKGANGKFLYQDEGDSDFGQYECPHCDTELTESEEEAFKILDGENID